MISTLRIALHPAIEPFAPEAKYALRTLLRLAGYGQHIVWASPADSEGADIYYGPDDWQGSAACRIAWCGKPLTDAEALEPRGLRHQDGLAFLDFGEASSGLHRSGNGQVHFASDIVLASFWLLTGARERHYRRDAYDNFHLDGSALLSSGALQQPLVSLYAAFLRRHFAAQGKPPAALPWAGPDGIGAAFIFSHDVDYPEMIRAIEFLRVLGGRTHASRRALAGVLTGANHFWRFADWVELAQRYGARPAFYFSARRGSLARYAAGTPDCFYDIRSPRFRELFRYLRDEGCEVGLHASYHAFKDAQQLRREKASLDEAAGVRVEGGRHHYWRLNPEAPHETLAHHQRMGMTYDSSLAFEFYPGFRRGVCHPFHPFDPRTRRELEIIELPPTWMDDHFDRRLAKNGIADPLAPEAEVTERTSAHARRLLDAVRSTGGVAVVDYHVRGMNPDFFPRYGPWLTRFAEKHFDSSLAFTAPREAARAYAEFESQLEKASSDATVEPAAIAATHQLEIGLMRADEVAAVAQMHYDFFGVGEMHGHSLANLGPDFLADVFYRLNLDNPSFFVDVARYGGQPIAFSVYVSNWRGLIGGVLRRHTVAFAVSMAKVFARKPIDTLRHVIGNITYATAAMPPEVNNIPACYLLLGIHEPYRTREFRECTGRWVIGEMWERMERTLSAAGCREFWSAPGAHNEPINRLFEKMATQKIGQAPLQGVLCNLYRKSLTAAGSEAR